MNISYKQRDLGSALLPFIILLPFLILIATYFTNLAVTDFKLARQDQFHTHSQLAADAGADYAIEQINQDNSWTGTSSEITLHSDTNIKTTYYVSVSDDSATSKTITSIGRTYSPANASSPSASVIIKVGARPVSSGNYSIVSGEGGLVMSNSSKVVAGSVLINGIINMQNTAQIGLTTNPVNVDVADAACPIPADNTYPRICNSGEAGDPISIGNQAHIYGTVRANNQSSGARMSNPGLTASSGITTQNLPTYDRAAQKSAVTTTITAASAGCSSGTKTWSANTKITGDVTVSGSCKVTVNGNIWITGSLTLKNTSQLIVSNSLGSTQPVIMIDSSAGATLSNSTQLISNSSSTGFEIITFWSNSSCSPNCTSLTGTELYNSKGTTTITLQQSSSGPQSIFYAYWSQVSVGNTGQIGALIGQTVNLNNSGTITFGTSVTTSSSFWVIDSYRRSYN